MENHHYVSIFHSIGCIVKIDQLIWKVNITVITTLETNWSQETTFSVVINSYTGNWILPNCTTVRLTLQLCFDFCFRSHFSCVCDLEYYYHFVVFIICLKRKLEWPQSPLTLSPLSNGVLELPLSFFEPD